MTPTTQPTRLAWHDGRLCLVVPFKDIEKIKELKLFTEAYVDGDTEAVYIPYDAEISISEALEGLAWIKEG
jgi:hypothetical protein